MKMCSLCQLKDMRERFIERKFVEAVKKKGGFAPKFVSPGLDGMPDRIVLFQIGKIAFVELKAPDLFKASFIDGYCILTYNNFSKDL